MLFPKKLKDGDTLLLTSFSSTSVTPAELSDKIKRFEAENNLKIHLDSTLLGTKTRHENLAKYRERMLNCINNLNLHDISALFSIRGGWSITDLLLNNKVDIDSLIEKIIEGKTMVLGYSDNTLLGDYINLAYGYVTYQSPNFEGLFSWSQESQDMFTKMLKERVEVSLPLSTLQNGAKDSLSGILISSNLECLTLSLAFTDRIYEEIRKKGVILLLEDVYLEPSLAVRYIEVILMRFKNEGIKVHAIVFGKFVHCQETVYKSWEGKTFNELIPHLTQYLEMPIYETDKIGHSETDGEEAGEDYYTTPSGAPVEIENGILKYSL